MAFCISTKHMRIYSQGKYKFTYFYVTASLRIFKKRTDDQQMSKRNDIYILIGGHNEMPFSETWDYPCAYVNRKRTINAITYLQHGGHFGKSKSGVEFL